MDRIKITLKAATHRASPTRVTNWKEAHPHDATY